MVTVNEALRIVLASVSPLASLREPLLLAAGRVLAEAVRAPLALPPFANSAMDGFALRASDVVEADAQAPVSLPIAFEVAAGLQGTPLLREGEACRIMTGAPLPEGADTVVRIEETREAAGFVEIRRAAARGENIRRAGEDVTLDSLLMAPGTPLTPARIALLAGVGRSHVLVHSRPRVAILTTGDELVEPGVALAPGQIYNSNAYALAALVQEAGGLPVRLAVARDDRARTRELLQQALGCDVVLTSGGVSVGAYDFVGETLAQLGTVHFTSVAQQPGKPFTFATVEGKPVFALPGNPVATMVNFEIYVRPALRKLQGHQVLGRPRVRATLDAAIPKGPGRHLFARAVLERGPDGFIARLSGPQGAGMLSSMATANALLSIPAEATGLGVGERVEALVLDPELLAGPEQADMFRPFAATPSETLR